MEIRNLTDAPQRRYGQDFEPHASKHIDDTVINTYALAESSEALKSIARNITTVVAILKEDRRFPSAKPLVIENTQYIYVENRITKIFNKLYRKAKSLWQKF